MVVIAALSLNSFLIVLIVPAVSGYPVVSLIPACVFLKPQLTVFMH